MASLGVNVTVGPRGGRIGSYHLEQITRPSQGERVLQEALARVPPVDNSGDADFSIGGPSAFTLTEPEKRTNPSISYHFPPEDDNKDKQDGIVVIDYDYVDRAVTIVRVENPDDKEQWVEIERIDRILFRRQTDNVYVRLTIDWSQKPSQSKKG